MAVQLLLWDAVPVHDSTTTIGTSIQERFEDFHRRNPWVIEALERLVREYTRNGNRRLGIGMLFEVLRWHYAMQTGDGGFKLNNNYRSRYARLILERNPSWSDMFETRELQSA